MSRYGLSMFKYLWIGLPIIALSFVVQATFDSKIAFAEQIAVDTLNLKVLTDSIGLDHKISKKLNKHLDSSLHALERPPTRLRHA